MVTAQQIIEAAKLTLQGVKDSVICNLLVVSQAELEAFKKTSRYRKTAQKMAKAMLEVSESELQAASLEAVECLRKTLKIKAHNRSGRAGSGLERKLADPSLLREQRLTAVSLLQLAREIRAEFDETEQLQPLLKELNET